MSVKHSLLALLQGGPLPAAGLKADFEAATGALWALNIGQVAQTLTRLERDGLIHRSGEMIAGNGHPTPVYQLTDAGTNELERWWKSPVMKARDGRDDLVMKVALAAATTSPGVIPLLDLQRAAVIAELREINRLRRSLPAPLSTAALVAERRVFELEAEARWLDRVESLLRTNAKDA